MAWLEVVLIALFFHAAISTDITCDCNSTFSTETVKSYLSIKSSPVNVELNLTCSSCKSKFDLVIGDETIAKISGNKTLHVRSDDEACFSGNISLNLLKVGKTYMDILDKDKLCRMKASKLEIFVLKEKGTLSMVFIIILAVLLVLSNIGLGLKIQVKLLLKLLKKPTAPLIGIIWQFFVMAPLSFAIAKGLQLDSVLALGLLAIGCSPSGGSGNIFAILLDADMELALLMNLTGLIAALATSPLWIWLLKPFLETFESEPITISVENVFASLAIVLFPVAIAMAVTLWQPKIAKFLQKALKPCLIIVGATFFGLGVAVYYYVIPFLHWTVYIATFLLPFIGYVSSGFVAYFLKSGKERAITVGCMVGFQNVGLAMLMLRLSLPAPDEDIGGAVPIVYMIMGGSLPTLAIIIRQTRLHLEKRKKKGEEANVDQELSEKCNGDGHLEAAEPLNQPEKIEAEKTEL